MGRRTPHPGVPSQGYDSAAAYVARLLGQMGVKPMGDNGTYFQHYTVTRSTLDTTRTKGSIGSEPLRWGDDFIVNHFLLPGTKEAGHRAINLEHAGLLDTHQSPEIEPLDLLEDVLELVRQQLCMVRARRQMHVGADLSAATLHHGEGATAAGHRGIDPNGDAQIVRFGNPRALSPERRGAVVDALDRLLDIVQETHVRGERRPEAPFPLGADDASEQKQPQRRDTHP
jgi:hypothetical protein